MATIKRLEIKNALGIKELELSPGQVNIISGGNEKGKTSLLESIEKAINNSERRAKFVRDGESEALLYVELDNGLSVERKIKPDGKGTVNVTRNGEKIRKPETLLKSLVGEFSFNPIDFMNKKDKEQTEILLSLIPMRVTENDLLEWFGEVPAVNLEQHALQVLTYLSEKYFYDRRTVANTEMKDCQNEIQALFEQLPDNYNGEEWRYINLGDLYKRVQEGQTINANREKSQQFIEGYEQRISALNNKYLLQKKEQEEFFAFKVQRVKDGIEKEKQEIQSVINDYEHQIEELKKMIDLKRKDLDSVEERAQVQIDSLESQKATNIAAIEKERTLEIEKVETNLTTAKEYLEKHQEIDITSIQSEAEEAERMKSFVPLYDKMKQAEITFEAKAAVAKQLDDYVKLARQKPAELLANIEMPVEGLGINEQMQITIDDMPIRNLSTSRQIKLALDIARATAGELKLINIDRFESLDAENQELFLKEIEGDGFQYFITTTDIEKDENGHWLTDLKIKTV
ncbi:hypothetical protein [Aneurinibacillus terranovensis]|uniref:hypothetical protein n=1 Tax=Aneurinibacillus terranovensis TaxID=278991 RepID=UPI0004287BF4|nr:hypothetical protein [Aneurinibacillus terranovensis]